jgi:hypothetical protein
MSCIIMDTKLTSFGYILEPSKYSPALGYAGLKVLIAGKPTQRLFDVKVMHLPTFDSRYYHRALVSRLELEPTEIFQVCLGQLDLETYKGEHLRAFSFGGVLKAAVEMDNLYCELTSTAPIFKLQDAPGTVSEIIADELMDLLAEQQARLPGHEDELYSRLAKIEPYPLFLACMVSLQKRIDSIPMSLRRQNFYKVSTNVKKAIQTVRDTDGWDGHSPGLEEILSKGGGS